MSVTRRRLTRLGAVCALAVASLIVVLPTPSASADPAPGPVKFAMRYNGRCLEADLAHITTNGDPVQVWDCYNDPGNQKWELEPTGAIYHGLPVIKLVNIGAGKCLESDLSHSGNGTPVQLWDCWSDPGNQQWQLVDVVPTFLNLTPGKRLVNVLTGQCLDIDLAHITNNGARAQLWGCWNDPGNERFTD